MSDRQLIIVDVESNGLDPERHEAVEVAWRNFQTGETGLFVPYHDVREILSNAQIEALRINRYIDRLALAEQDRGGEGARLLAQQLDGGATLAGSNPRFDAAMLLKMFRGYEDRETSWTPSWHHRLWDLSAYAAGVLGLDGLPGLATTCDLLGVTPEDPHNHTAAEGVRAATECFTKLFAIVNVRKERAA